ncbi:URAD (predicted) [Pycnogonum litorale]
MFSIDQVNSLNYKEFMSIFGNVVENCQLCSSVLWLKRPYRNVDEMCDSANEIVDQLTITGKQSILLLHPNLAGKLSTSELSKESSLEQQSVGLTNLSSTEQLLLTDLNQKYTVKFGIPFVICVRKYNKSQIIQELYRRIGNNKKDEIFAGIEQVKMICKLRILDILVNKDKKYRFRSKM